jgi:hypothetical protein
VGTRIEYAAYYPFNMDDDTEWVYYGPVTHKEAMGMVRYVNARALQAGSPHRATLQRRKVTVGEWEPANTGIVPPHITERIESD